MCVGDLLRKGSQETLVKREGGVGKGRNQQGCIQPYAVGDSRTQVTPESVSTEGKEIVLPTQRASIC